MMISQLENKKQLSEALRAFENEAGDTENHLREFYSQVMTAVNKIMIVNDKAVDILQDLQKAEQRSLEGSQ